MIDADSLISPCTSLCDHNRLGGVPLGAAGARFVVRSQGASGTRGMVGRIRQNYIIPPWRACPIASCFNLCDILRGSDIFCMNISDVFNVLHVFFL